MEKTSPDVTIDTFGLMCPMPIVKAAKAIKSMAVGQVLEILASDPGISNDLPLWCKSAGQEFISLEENNGEYRGLVRKIK